MGGIIISAVVVWGIVVWGVLKFLEIIENEDES